MNGRTVRRVGAPTQTKWIVYGSYVLDVVFHLSKARDVDVAFNPASRRPTEQEVRDRLTHLDLAPLPQTIQFTRWRDFTCPEGGGEPCFNTDYWQLHPDGKVLVAVPARHKHVPLDLDNPPALLVTAGSVPRGRALAGLEKMDRYPSLRSPATEKELREMTAGMFLQGLSIEGYKCFGKRFDIRFSRGLNVLVGENASGKSAVVDAIRLLLLEDEFGRAGILDTDFHRSFSKDAKAAEVMRLCATLSDLSKEETVAFLPWTELKGDATLTLEVENKEGKDGRFKPTRWGGASRASAFEWELFDAIDCVYLPPLRDAEAKLREGKGSRLARLLKNLNQEALDAAKKGGAELPLVQRVAKFNMELAADTSEPIAKANDLIRMRLQEAIGSVFGQDTRVQFSEVNFSRIVESLRLLFFPDLTGGTSPEMFRSLHENSLGYNNLLYLATVLAELTDTTSQDRYLRVLLIEEPEAHLHPQLQVRLLSYLEETARNQGIQIIVTTHSPVLASSASLDAMIHLSRGASQEAMAVSLKDCGLMDESKADSKAFLGRWLDATKSTLLFARAVILVEGIAEALVLPELARRVLRKYNAKLAKGDVRLPESLADAGVSVINMNGIYFRHFMQLFCDLSGKGAKSLPVHCAGITDQDPRWSFRARDEKTKVAFTPVPADVERKDHVVSYFRFPPHIFPVAQLSAFVAPAELAGRNPALALAPTVNESEWARLYANDLKTFEYDLAMTGSNLAVMLPLAARLAAGEPEIHRRLATLSREDWTQGLEQDGSRAEAAYFLLNHIDKGEFAQALADRIQDSGVPFKVPQYIREAILWTVGGIDV